jgi:hypothetical protein
MNRRTSYSAPYILFSLLVIDRYSDVARQILLPQPLPGPVFIYRSFVYNLEDANKWSFIYIYIYISPSFIWARENEPIITTEFN